MGQPLHVNDDNFKQEVLESDIPVVIDFWAPWCGPCRMIAPIIEEMATDYNGKAKMCKVDVDTSQQTAMQYGIRSIPTVLIFKNGEVVESIIGAVPKHRIVESLEKHI